MSTKKGNIIVFIGALAWSTYAPLVHSLSAPAIFTACFRALIAGVVLCPFLRKANIKPSKPLFVFLISFTGLSASLTLAIKNTDAPIAIGMQYASILWIFATNFFVMGKKDYEKIPSILLILVGVIFFMTSGSGSGSTFGNTIAFTESIFFTTMTISSQKIDCHPLPLTALANLVTGLVLLPIVGSDCALLFTFSAKQYLLLFLIGAVQAGVGYSMYNLGLRYTTSQNASLIAISEMILGPLWVFLIFHEGSSAQTLVGFGFIIVGLVTNGLVSIFGAPAFLTGGSRQRLSVSKVKQNQRR